MKMHNSMADEITEKQRKAWARIYSATERCAPPSPLEVTQDQLRAARKLQNRLREALAPFANQTAELDNNSESLSAITDEQWREALEAYFATEDAR